MSDPLRLTTQVLPGHRIEIAAPALPVGTAVDIVVLPRPTLAGDGRRYTMLEIIESLNGHRMFQTAEEVDEYLRAERDSWER